MVMEAHPAHQMEGHPSHPLDAHQSAHPLEARTLEAHQLESSRAINDSQQMEPNPTPQCVGLEFVRQYYTILNKAPWHLHRFYATNSSFMHSGENSNRQAIIGQGNIHKSIMGLDFDDCHAKILLIDSQTTLADGIVIQVTGELSNRGSPMRRFMQTFVLAPQSEKKYYVHNDIFRYQDQVFNDDSGSQVDEASEEVEIEEPTPEEPEMVRPQVNGTAPPVVPSPAPQVVQQQPPPPTPPVVQQPTIPAPTSPPTQISSPPRQVEVVAPVNPSATKPDTWNEWTEPAPVKNEWQTPEITSPVEVPAPQPPKRQPVVSPQPTKQEKKAPAASSAPPPQRSYAAFFKETSSAPAPSSNPTVAQPPVQQAPQPAPQQAPREAAASRNTAQQPLPPRSERGAPATSEGGFQRAGRGGRGGNFRQRNSTNFSESEESESVSAEGYIENVRRRPSPPDTHQIFVGNLPQMVKEEELKKAFQTYGNITDVRINIGKGKVSPSQNGNPKNSASHVVPNFGFVTFSDDSAVAKCLKDRPITIMGDHRLNVEEKKTKNKSESYGPRPQGVRSNMGGRGGFNRMEGGRGGQRGGYNAANNRQR